MLSSLLPRNIFGRVILDRDTYEKRYINFSPYTNLATNSDSLGRQSRV